MRAVVMAGGQGARLRPLTSNQPKPMLPIVGQPMMQHILRLARSHGITDVVATVHFLASIVRNFFGDGSDLGVSLSYATEEEPLGTAGSVKNAGPLLEDRFIVLSGDALTDIDLTDLVRFHESKGGAVTVALKRVENPLEFGIVITDEEGRVERFLEKPGWGDVFSDTANTGIYVLEREVLDFVPSGTDFDFSKDLFPLLLDKGLPVYGYVTDRYWTDVGNLEAYMSAHRDVLDRRVEVQIEGFEVREGVWLGEGGRLHPDAEVRGPAFIGENATVEGGVTIREYSVLGRGGIVRSGAFLHRCVVHDYVYVGPSVTLRGCVVGRDSDVKFGARLEEGVVVANACHIGEGAVLNPQVKVYPFKSVDPGAIVSDSIIWQSGGARGLFGERGVTGIFNVDLTPETALRLATAYASVLPQGSAVVACRDVTRAARIMKRAMVAGVNGAAVECHDLELVPSPVARFYAHSARAVGGFSVRTAAFDPASVEIQFFDERGVDVGPGMQREIERAYYREDLRRAFHHDIGELKFPARGREYYTRGLLDALDREAIQKRAPKLVVDFSNGGAALIGPLVMGKLRVQLLAVNGVLDEEAAALSEGQVEASIDRLGKLVPSSGSELGGWIDSPGERLRLVDGKGRTLATRTALLAYVWLISETTESPRVALPVATSRVAEEIVAAKGGEVVWTRISSAALMASAAEEEGVTFAGDEGGGYIFPSFLPAFDALMSLAKLLELLATANTTLDAVVDRLPPAHIARRDVPTPWEAKGTVMRRILEQVDGSNLLTIDGVKAFTGNDWILVIPHPQEPLVRVWAEAGSQEDADRLAARYAAMLEEMKG